MRLRNNRFDSATFSLSDIDPDDFPEGAGMAGGMPGAVPPGMEEGGELDDVDKAGAVYDAALDAEKWCTTENGKHFELDTETGQITKGNIGQENEHFGPAYPAFKGKPHEAIEHLLKEKSGHVPGAFHKDGLGDIDLPYGKGGKDGYGLAHIIERRNEQNQDGEVFARNLPSLIQEGKVEYRKRFPRRAYVVHEKREAVIRLDWDGKERKWMITAYPLEKKISGAQDGCRTCVLTFDDRQSFPLPYAGVHPAKPPKKRKRVASGGHGKFSQDTRLRKPGLVFSRPGLGAEVPAEKIVPLSRSVNAHGHTSALKGESFMGRLKHWFRGAKDADPGIERPVLHGEGHAGRDLFQRQPHGHFLLRREQHLEQGGPAFQRCEQRKIVVRLKVKAEERHIFGGKAHEQASAAPGRLPAGAAAGHQAKPAQRARMTSPMPAAMVTK